MIKTARRLALLVSFLPTLGVPLVVWLAIGGNTEAATALGVAIGVVFTLGLMVLVSSVVRQARGVMPTKYARGEVGIGTITAVEPTGTSINDNPVLRLRVTVTTSEGEMFDSVAEQLVPLHQMHEIAVGLKVAVRYLPDDRREVVLDNSGDSRAQEAFDRAMLAEGLTSQRSLDIGRRGMPAKAVITSMEPTGILRNGNPELTIGLSITEPNGEQHRTTTTKVLSTRMVGHVQPGAVVDVRYLPGNLDEVVLALPNT